MRIRTLILLSCLLCAACSGMAPRTEALPIHVFPFADGGSAHYLMLERSADALPPRTLVFVVPGSDCAGMGTVSPQYFDGLAGEGGLRLFILHKRFVAPYDDGRHCTADFIAHDHPSRWLADHMEFIAAQLALADVAGQAPARILVLGISEGGEVVPQLALRLPRITHVAIIGNGGMDPLDSYRLQARRHNFERQAQRVEQRCRQQPEGEQAGRSCRYWNELFALQHKQALLQLRQPLFVAMGEADEMVPVESAHVLAREFAHAGRKNLRLILLPDANHGFFQHGRPQLAYLWDALDRWLLE